MGKLSKELDLDRLSDMKWHYIHRRLRTPFYTFLLYDGISHHWNRKIDFPYEMKDVLYVDGEIAFSEEVWDTLEGKVLAEMERNRHFVARLFDMGYELNIAIDDMVSDILHGEFRNVSGEKLASQLVSFADSLKQASAFMVFPLFVEHYLENSIRNLLEKQYPRETSDMMWYITTPKRLSSTEEAELDLLDIAILQSAGKHIESAVREHIAQFGWLKNTSMNREFYTEEEIRSKVEALSINDPYALRQSYTSEKESLRNRIESYKTRLKDDRMAVWIDTLQEAIYYRSWRTERFYRNAFLLRDFFDEIADRIAVREPADVFYLLPDEIADMLRTGSSAEQGVIEERKRGYVMYGDGVDTRIHSGEIVAMTKRKIRFHTEVGESDELRGQSAYPGIVSGPVRRILSRGDFEKVREDDILVAHSTMPDYVPIMKKAAAIVTDEGGVLSHASVMSRELKKPCVIGTKIATQALHDGDLVEVDANRGVVRVIERTSDKQ